MKNPQSSQPIDTQLLSDFIYELNIARKQFTLYPSDHPQIKISGTRVLAKLEKLLEMSSSICLGIIPDKIMFEDEWLDENNPVFKSFSRALSEHEIISIRLHKGLELDELTELNKLLSVAKSANNPINVSPLRNFPFRNIDLEFIDYQNFQANSLGGTQAKVEQELLWEDILSGLQKGLLDADGQPLTPQERLDVNGFEELLEQFGIENSDKGQPYEKAISSFVARLSESCSADRPQKDKQVSDFIEDMSPALKNSFIKSSFRSLEQHHGASANTDVAGGAYNELITALQKFSVDEKHISTRILDLLGQFIKNKEATKGLKTHSLQIEQAPEMTLARTDMLLLEDRHDEYMPRSYQNSLKCILTGKLKSDLSEDIKTTLRNQFAKSVNENHYRSTLFHVLLKISKPESETSIQNNLVDLSRYFFETGNFSELKKVHNDWSSHLYSGKGYARFLDEQVIAAHTNQTFMNDVIDSVELWGSEKFEEICDYIKQIGEPYAELLIERLANDEKMARRKTWMKILLKLGPAAHQIIIENLETGPWYLTRNLIMVLGQQKEAMPIKKVLEYSRHPDPRVRKESLRILYHYNLATANRLLLKELLSVQETNLIAVLPLAEIAPDLHILDQLHALLLQEHKEPSDLTIKKALIKTLVKIGRKESIPILGELLKKRGLTRPRWLKELQKTLGESLVECHKEDWKPLLYGK